MIFFINIFTGLFAFALFVKDTKRVLDKIDPYNYWNIFEYMALMIPSCSFFASLKGFLQIAEENQKCKISTSPSDVAEICN